MGQVVTQQQLVEIRRQLRQQGKRVVFTNGCFDIIHRGHVDYLIKARALGDVLVVGMNSDASVQRLKGPTRPIVEEQDRSFVLAALSCVDYVCLFEDDTPLALITAIVPDVLVKGGDWSIENIVGREIVEQAGGSVQTISFVPNRSTTNIVQKIAKVYNKE